MDKLFVATVTITVQFPLLAKDRKSAEDLAEFYLDDELRIINIEDCVENIYCKEMTSLNQVPKMLLGSEVYNEVGNGLTPEDYFERADAGD